MATKFCASEISYEGIKTSVALFSDSTSMTAMEDFCNTQLECGSAREVVLLNLDTGVIEYGVCHDDDYPDYLENLEMGFDPYLGCYSDDC